MLRWILNRPGSVGVVAVAALSALLLSGCQDGRNIGVVNQCGYAVEATADSVDILLEEYWQRIESEQGAHIVTIGDVEETLYVWVRRQRGDSVMQFAVPVAELRTPPSNASYGTDVSVDLELVLEGDLCP